MPTGMASPGHGPLLFPAMLHDLALFAGVLDHVPGDLGRLWEATSPGAQPLGRLGGIAPELAQALGATRTIPL